VGSAVGQAFLGEKQFSVVSSQFSVGWAASGKNFSIHPSSNILTAGSIFSWRPTTSPGCLASVTISEPVPAGHSNLWRWLNTHA